MADTFDGMEPKAFRPLHCYCACRNPIPIADGKSHLGCRVTCAKCSRNFTVRYEEADKAEGIPAMYYLEEIR